MYVALKRCLNSAAGATLIALALFTQSCKKDNPDPIPTVPTHVSNLVDNSGWTTVGYSTDYYTNNIFSDIPPYIPAQWRFKAAEIGPNGPNFVIQETVQNWITDPIHSYQMVVTDNSDLFKYASQIPFGKTRITSPVNLAPHNLQPDFDYYSNRWDFQPLFYNNSFYAWSDLKRDGNGAVANTIRFIVKDGGLSYGWFNYANARSLPNGHFDQWYTFARIEGYSNILLMELNNQTAMVSAGKFGSIAEGYVFGMTAKYWTSATDSIDIVSVINHNGELYHDDYIWTKACKVGSKIAAGFNLTLDRDLHLVFGDFTNGFNVIPANLSGGDLFELIEGQHEAFLITGKPSDPMYQVVKIDESGVLTDYGAVLDLSYLQVLNSTVYKGDLVMAVYDYSNIGEYRVYRITASGMEVLGASNLVKSTYLVGTLNVVGDENSLYAVIQNCVSPVYVDEYDYQYCGWELIKFDE